MAKHLVWSDKDDGTAWPVVLDGKRIPAIRGGDTTPDVSAGEKFCPVHKSSELETLWSKEVGRIVGAEIGFQYCTDRACGYVCVLSPTMEVKSLPWEKKLALFTVGRVLAFEAKFVKHYVPDNL